MFKDVQVGRRPAESRLKNRPPGCVPGRPASGIPAAILMEIKAQLSLLFGAGLATLQTSVVKMLTEFFRLIAPAPAPDEAEALADMASKNLAP